VSFPDRHTDRRHWMPLPPMTCRSIWTCRGPSADTSSSTRDMAMGEAQSTDSLTFLLASLTLRRGGHCSQRSLFHVLHAFSMVCDECGYCQGMGPIAATLLCYFDPQVRANLHSLRDPRTYLVRRPHREHSMSWFGFTMSTKCIRYFNPDSQVYWKDFMSKRSSLNT
jgi:hypothetical protein